MIHQSSRQFALALVSWLTMAVLASAAAAYGQDLLQFQQDSLQLRLSKNPADETSVNLSMSGLPYRGAKVFKLKQPARIVIDLKGANSKLGHSFHVTDSALVKEVRLGSHPDKVRVVLELRADQVPEYSFTEGTNVFALRTGNSGGQLIGSGAPSIPGQRPIAPELPEVGALNGSENAVAAYLGGNLGNGSPASQPGSLPTIPTTDNSARARLDMEPLSSQAASSAANSMSQNAASLTKTVAIGPALQDIVFQEPSPDAELGEVWLLMTVKREFTLSKSGEREFIIRVSGIETLPDRLRLPYFPPEKIEGITVINPNLLGNTLEVKVGVERGYRISAVNRDNNLIIRPKRNKWSN